MLRILNFDARDDIQDVFQSFETLHCHILADHFSCLHESMEFI